MRAAVVALGAMLCCACPKAERAPARPVEVPRLSKGARAVFLGDSITEQGWFAEYVEGYFVARHPEVQWRFWNRGQRGDTVLKALDRFDADVRPLDPDVVVVFLGMNDGGLRGRDRRLLVRFLQGLEMLIDHIRSEADSEVVLMTPIAIAPVDEEAIRYNQMLAEMSAGATTLGARQGVLTVDVHRVFARALEASAKARPPLVLMEDRIHPNAAGHLIIAEALVSALDPLTSRGEIIPVRLDDRPFEVRRMRSGCFEVAPEASAAVSLLAPNAFGTTVLDFGASTEKVEILIDGRLVLSLSGDANGPRALRIDGIDGAPCRVRSTTATDDREAVVVRRARHSDSDGP